MSISKNIIIYVISVCFFTYSCKKESNNKTAQQDTWLNKFDQKATDLDTQEEHSYNKDVDNSSTLQKASEDLNSGESKSEKPIDQGKPTNDISNKQNDNNDDKNNNKVPSGNEGPIGQKKPTDDIPKQKGKVPSGNKPQVPSPNNKANNKPDDYKNDDKNKKLDKEKNIQKYIDIIKGTDNDALDKLFLQNIPDMTDNNPKSLFARLKDIQNYINNGTKLPNGSILITSDTEGNVQGMYILAGVFNAIQILYAFEIVLNDNKCDLLVTDGINVKFSLNDDPNKTMDEYIKDKEIKYFNIIPILDLNLLNGCKYRHLGDFFNRFGQWGLPLLYSLIYCKNKLKNDDIIVIPGNQEYIYGSDNGDVLYKAIKKGEVGTENKTFWGKMLHKIFPEFVHYDLVNDKVFLFSHTCLKRYNGWGFEKTQEITNKNVLQNIMNTINTKYKDFKLNQIDDQISNHEGYENNLFIKSNILIYHFMGHSTPGSSKKINLKRWMDPNNKIVTFYIDNVAMANGLWVGNKCSKFSFYINNDTLYVQLYQDDGVKDIGSISFENYNKDLEYNDFIINMNK